MADCRCDWEQREPRNVCLHRPPHPTSRARVRSLEYGDVGGGDVKVIYLAHPLSGDFEANRASAKRWGAWLATTFKVGVVMDWVWMSECLPETAENRTLGLECDKALIGRCDGIFLCGPRLSDGMNIEWEHATAVDVPSFNAATKTPEDFAPTEQYGLIDDLEAWLDELPERGP